MKTKIIIGLSGGVDSAVAALLLLEQGYQVEALFMKNWEEDDAGEYCAAAVDLADAQAVAKQLDIPLHTINFSTEYWDHVFQYFLAEYKAGRTPNPDILCNTEIKFKAFLDKALSLGADKMATGHYAEINQQGKSFQLCQAAEQNKDQTYFLHQLNQYQLAHSLFPLGKIKNKQEVRDIALKAGFSNAKKKDSTGICFIGERKFKDFLAQYLPANPGKIVTLEGQEIAQHQGLMYYTIGQRQGLGIGGVANALEEPWFVVKKDLKQNQLIVTQGHHHPALLSDYLTTLKMHWINQVMPDLNKTYVARCRHRQALQKCQLKQLENQQWQVIFEQPQRAIAAGQSVVIYDKQVCLGGGIIDHAFKTTH